jgi:hypothetical protein
MKIEKVKIEEIILNPNNPRIIKNDKFKKLVKSIKEFPEMLEVRPIVVDNDMVVLGGNMRTKACIEAGLSEVHIIRFSNLSDDKKKEFIVKDNVGYGEWDFDLLLEDWTKEKLIHWGMDIPNKKDKKEVIDGEVEINKSIDFSSNYIVLKFHNDIDWLYAQGLFGLVSGWNLGGKGEKYNMGVGKVVDGIEAIEKIKKNYEG